MRFTNGWLGVLCALCTACIESPTQPVESHSADGSAATAEQPTPEAGLDAQSAAQPPGEPGAREADAASTADEPLAEPADDASVSMSEDAAQAVVDARVPECTQASDCASNAQKSRCSGDGECAVCLAHLDCQSVVGAPKCLAGAGCVACLGDADCKDEDAPHCDLAAHRCVGCTDSAQCTSAEASRCGASQTCEACKAKSDCSHIAAGYVCTEDGVCAECGRDADCKDPAKSRCGAGGTCQPCEQSANCAHLASAGKGACFAGSCVECTRNEREACAQTESGRAVCHAETHRCSERAPGASSLCDECVSDEQCRPGQRCVQSRGAGPWVCLWQRGARGGAPIACSPQGAPFASERALASIDERASELPMCDLRTASCAAYKAFSQPCGRYGMRPGTLVSNYGDSKIPEAERGKPATAQAIRPDPAACGAGGTCVAASAETGTYECTMLCGGTQDCKSGFACSTQLEPNYCAAQ